MKDFRRRQIWMAKLPSEGGSVQAGVRPVVIVQNDKGNKHSSTVIIAPLTSQMKKLTQPTHAEIPSNQLTGLRVDSLAQMEQVRTIPKNLLMGYVGECDQNTMNKVDRALAISQGLIPDLNPELVQ